MNLLLIGGTGFMGSNLAAYFSTRKSDYVVTVSRSAPPLLPGVTHYNLSAINWEQIVEQLQRKKDWVAIDLAYATIPNTSFADPIKDFSDNLYLVNRHLGYLEQLHLSRYLYISSGGTIYGEPLAIPIPETAANFPLSPYGITKMAAERYVYMHHRLHGLPAIIVRPSNIYGPGQAPLRGQGFIATALGQAARNAGIQVYGDGEQTRDYLYVADFCRGIEALIDQGVPGEIYNLGAGYGLSLNQIVDAINGLLRPEGLFLDKEMLPGRPFDVRHNVLDCTRLRELAGWSPDTPFDEGLRRTWDWVREAMS